MTNLADKISKLVAKANSCREINSLEEAELFMSKAYELALENGLVDALTEEVETDKNDNVRDLSLRYHCSQTGNVWKKNLHQVLCKYFGCYATYTPILNKEGILSTYGPANRVESVVSLFNGLTDTLFEMSKEYFRSLPKESRDSSRSTILKSFLLGAVVGIYNKLESKAKEVKDDNGGGLIVLLNKSVNVLAQKFENEYSKVRTVKQRVVSVSEKAFQKGKIEGGKMNIDDTTVEKTSKPSISKIINCNIVNGKLVKV